MNYPHDCELYENGSTVTNPLSDESCFLPADALSVYDVIKGSEALGKFDKAFVTVWIGFRNIIQKNTWCCLIRT